VYTGYVRERRCPMEVCVKCGVSIGQFEVFPEQVCVKCFAVEFEKEFQSALKVGRFK
jgi:ribosomal protein L40E